MAALVPESEKRHVGWPWQDQVVPTLSDSTSGKRKSPPDSRSKSTIFLIRHGDYYRDSKLQHLTPDGKAQAHRAGKSFKEQGIIPTIVYHSNLPRSVEIILSYFSSQSSRDQGSSTGAVPSYNFGVVCSHLLREVSFNPIGIEPVFKV